jgi:hypothetical protein
MTRDEYIKLFFRAREGRIGVARATYFPTLTIPAAPTDAAEAIMTNANCMRELLRFLNTYSNANMTPMDVGDYAGSLNPSVVGTFMAQTVLDDTSLPYPGGNENVLDYIRLENAPSGYEAITAINEVPAKRASVLSGLGIITEAIALFPDIETDIGGLLPIAQLAISIVDKPGKIAVEVGEIIFFHLIGFLKDYLINTYVRPPDGGQTITLDPCVCANLELIANRLKNMYDEEQFFHNGYQLENLIDSIYSVASREEKIELGDAVVFGKTGIYEPA